MIASFFQNLEGHRVRWLLISGQATILYGAATFSEDIDIWVEPSSSNLERLREALRASRASYYKLTPPLTEQHACAGHGFHFVLPSDAVDVYLDVMGKPPRVGDFARAASRARQIDTPWGSLTTVGIKDLVELKKTQRPRDYPIIGRLALAWLREKASNLGSEDVAWAQENVFGIPEFSSLLELPGVASLLPRTAHALVARSAEELARSGELSPALEDELAEWLNQRTLPLMRADRQYWRAIIGELRTLRSSGGLMAQGSPV